MRHDSINKDKRTFVTLYPNRTKNPSQQSAGRNRDSQVGFWAVRLPLVASQSGLVPHLQFEVMCVSIWRVLAK